MDEACRMHLDPFQVDCVGTDSHGHLQSVASAMLTYDQREGLAKRKASNGRHRYKNRLQHKAAQFLPL
eukprot:3722996-Amphidinium_carterae.1